MKDKFSFSEQKVLDILGKRKMTIAEIAEEFYTTVKPTVNPSNSITTFLGNINRKTSYYKLNWCIEGAGAGRGGKTVWITKRKA